MTDRVTASLNTYRALPKVELHRHLEGSLRLDTMVEIARKHGIEIPDDVLRLSTLVQVQEEDKFTFQNYLSKFGTLRMFYRSPEVIHRVTREAIEDAAKDNVKYLELRFTPVALSRAERFPLHDVIDWVIASTNETAQKNNIIVKLIASVNRHESTDLAEQVAWLAAEHNEGGMIVGLDLAGSEAEYPAAPFLGIFKEAKQEGLHVTIHAGEWGPAEHIREAIEELGAERIGHGVRVLEDENITTLARERQKLMDAGLNVTINTDNTSVSRITLSNEYYNACEDLGMPQKVLKERIIAAATAGFLPDKEKEQLVNQLKKDLKM